MHMICAADDLYLRVLTNALLTDRSDDSAKRCFAKDVLHTCIVVPHLLVHTASQKLCNEKHKT